jgi:diadenosine tetraphosphate (Ap4A) HIT family hydrolase
MKKECVFCSHNELAEKAVIKEGKDFDLMLDPFPVSNGHTLIVTKKREKIEKLETDTEIQEKIIKAKKLAKNKEKLKEKYFEILKA